MRNLLFFLLGLAATLLMAFSTLRAGTGAAAAKGTAVLVTTRSAARYTAMCSPIVAARPRAPVPNSLAVDQAVAAAPSAAGEVPWVPARDAQQAERLF